MNERRKIRIWLTIAKFAARRSGCRVVYEPPLRLDGVDWLWSLTDWSGLRRKKGNAA